MHQCPQGILHWTTETICRRYDSGAEVNRHLPRDGGRREVVGVEGEKKKRCGERKKERRRENLGGRGYLYFFQWLKDRKELGDAF
jgi:hypothetical protein